MDNAGCIPMMASVLSILIIILISRLGDSWDTCSGQCGCEVVAPPVYFLRPFTEIYEQESVKSWNVIYAIFTSGNYAGRHATTRPPTSSHLPTSPVPSTDRTSSRAMSWSSFANPHRDYFLFGISVWLLRQWGLSYHSDITELSINIKTASQWRTTLGSWIQSVSRAECPVLHVPQYSSLGWSPQMPSHLTLLLSCFTREYTSAIWRV